MSEVENKSEVTVVTDSNPQTTEAESTKDSKKENEGNSGVTEKKVVTYKLTTASKVIAIIAAILLVAVIAVSIWVFFAYFLDDVRGTDEPEDEGDTQEVYVQTLTDEEQARLGL